MGESVYKLRMNEYYPDVIRGIEEYQGVINSEYPEFEAAYTESGNVLKNAYFSTMDETRLTQWESALRITPVEGSSLEDRRMTLIARFRGQSKLNTETISSIVNAFTGGSARSWLDNGVLYVEITPPPGNRQYQFENVKQELVNKLPAHLSLDVKRNYYTWEELASGNRTWQTIADTFDTWEDVLLYLPFS